MRQRATRAALVAGLCLFLGIGVLAHRNAERFREAGRLVTHTREVLDALDRLHRGLREAESGRRAYVITAEEGHLAAYRMGVSAVPPALEQVARLTADDAVQRARLERLRPAVEARLSNLEESLRSSREQPGDKATQVALTESGTGAMTAVLHLIDEMKDAETLLMSTRQKAAEAASRRADLTYLVGLGAGLVFLAVAVVLLSREIADRAKAERELDRFFTLSLDLLAIASFDGFFKRMNPAWKKALGYEERELLSRPFIEFIHPDDHEKTLAEARKLASTGEDTLAFENRYRHQDGSYRTILWNTAADRESGLLYAAARDVTKEREAEAEIHRLTEQLSQRLRETEAANKELEAFSYSVSHDLRAPLRSVDGFSQALLEDFGPELPEKAQDYLGRIRRATQRMGELIDALLTLARVSRAEIRIEPTDLTAIAGQVLLDLRKAEPGRRVDVTIADGLVAEGDPRLLRTAVENLLQNAWKFTGKKEQARIEMGVDGAKDGKRVFFVKDDGAGFDPRYSGKLFGAFQRLHGQGDFPGTGIGLATVQRVVHRHGGEVWAEGRPDHGATFFFTL
jgi:PAS domain S-box-containing protein